MIFRWLFMFGMICLGLTILTNLNYWQIDHVGNKVIWGYRFRSAWSFWGALGVIAAPALIFVNVLFWAIYYYGYNFWFKKLWIIQISTYAAGLLMMAVITWCWYGELPNKGTLVGAVLCIAGAVTSIVWK
jgi:hypothetical protein